MENISPVTTIIAFAICWLMAMIKCKEKCSGHWYIQKIHLTNAPISIVGGSVA